MTFDNVYAATRGQLRGLAESLIAGPQHRAAGTVRLAVRPGGFTGTAIPLAVQGIELVWPNGAAPLTGRLDALAAAVGVDAGPPEGIYELVDPMAADAVLDIDPAAADWLYRAHYAGGHALKQVLPECHPVLWPEHFDVAATDDQVNFGVSAGDGYHSGPYAYVGPLSVPNGEFWNAPFGAMQPLDRALDLDDLTVAISAFFERGRAELR